MRLAITVVSNEGDLIYFSRSPKSSKLVATRIGSFY